MQERLRELRDDVMRIRGEIDNHNEPTWDGVVDDLIRAEEAIQAAVLGLNDA